MAHLFLFTDQYPWGKGEKTFVEPEIEVLRHYYDITIVSMASQSDYRDVSSKSEVLSGIEVVHWARPSLFFMFIRALSFPFSKPCRIEFRKILNDGFSFARLLDSVKSYAIAKSLQSFYKKEGMLSDSDSIYYSFWFSYQLLALSFIRADLPIRLLSRIHGYELYNSRNNNGRQPFQWFKKRSCEMIIFASSKAMECFIEEYGTECSPKQFFLNRLGVSKRNHLQEEDDSKKKLIVSCSNVIPIKRVELIVEGIANAKHKNDIKWVHFGDGESMPLVKKLVRKYGIDAELYGATNNEVIIDFYNSNYVSAVILTSSTEGGCPVCIQEALSFGIPIIGTNVGGVPEEINGNGKLLSKDPSIEELSAAIDFVCFADQSDREDMRLNSLRIWEQRFDVKKNKKDLISAFKDKGLL